MGKRGKLLKSVGTNLAKITFKIKKLLLIFARFGANSKELIVSVELLPF